MTPYPIGSIVRVANPDSYLSEFAKKIRDRDAVVLEAIQDWDYSRGASNEKSFRGRLMIEFQKRNGRGKVFTEIMHQRDLVPQEPSP